MHDIAAVVVVIVVGLTSEEGFKTVSYYKPYTINLSVNVPECQSSPNQFQPVHPCIVSALFCEGHI